VIITIYGATMRTDIVELSIEMKLSGKTYWVDAELDLEYSSTSPFNPDGELSPTWVVRRISLLDIATGCEVEPTESMYQELEWQINSDPELLVEAC
jgi:hypothetical protein